MELKFSEIACSCLLAHIYHTPGNFQGRNFRKLVKFCGENVREEPQTSKFTKVFSLESFPLYGINFVTKSDFTVDASSPLINA